MIADGGFPVGIGGERLAGPSIKVENEQEDVDSEDKIVCGKCSMTFTLNDVQRFLKHKEEQCEGSLTASLVHKIQQAAQAANKNCYSLPDCRNREPRGITNILSGSAWELTYY